MKGCSHILTTEDVEKIKWEGVGKCVDLCLEPIGVKNKACGRVLYSPRINSMLDPLFISTEKKVLFDIEEVYSPYGLSYKFDSSISRIAARITDYQSEVFIGSDWLPPMLEKMAKALLEKAGSRKAAEDWILRDEPPAGCKSLAIFLLQIAHPSAVIHKRKPKKR